MSTTEAPAVLLLTLGGLAAISVAVWAALTGQPWVAAGATLAVLAAVTVLTRIGQQHLPAGDTTETQPWTAHNPDSEQHGPATIVSLHGPSTARTVTEKHPDRPGEDL